MLFSGIVKERERGGGVAGGDGRVDGVVVPEEDPRLALPPTAPIDEPRAESELRILDALDDGEIDDDDVAYGVRARDAELNVACVGVPAPGGGLILKEDEEGEGVETTGTESG